MDPGNKKHGVCALDQSDDKDAPKHITKAGSALMRRLHYILHAPSPDTALKHHGERIGARGGKVARRKAKTAIARKLAVIMLAMLKSGRRACAANPVLREKTKVAKSIFGWGSRQPASYSDEHTYRTMSMKPRRSRYEAVGEGLCTQELSVLEEVELRRLAERLEHGVAGRRGARLEVGRRQRALPNAHFVERGRSVGVVPPRAADGIFVCAAFPVITFPISNFLSCRCFEEFYVVSP